MGQWPATKASRVFSALKSLGWAAKRTQEGSHLTRARDGWPDFIFAFHDNAEIGPKMPARIAKKTGLTPSDL